MNLDDAAVSHLVRIEEVIPTMEGALVGVYLEGLMKGPHGSRSRWCSFIIPADPESAH